MENKDAEKYVDKITYIKICNWDEFFQKHSCVFAYGCVVEDHQDDQTIARVAVEHIFCDGQLLYLPSIATFTINFCADMGYVWGKLFEPKNMKFRGFMKNGTPEEFVKLVFADTQKSIEAVL